MATSDPQLRSRNIRRVLVQVLVLNLAVALAKGMAFISSNALSVAAEVTHSSLDAANNVFALLIARFAAQGPDEDHPYGHQKFETLGALLVAGLLSITVFELVKTAASRIAADNPPTIEATPLALGVMAASLLAGLWIATYESRRGRALGSDLLLADATHTRSDVLTTLGVLGGLIAVRAGYAWVDPWISFLVAAVIGHTGWRIIRSSVPVLVDQRAVDPVRIQRVAEAQAEVLSCYGIRSRGRAEQLFAELTISVDSSLDVARSHAIADAVEQRVAKEIGAREVVVHVEPEG